MSVLTASNRTVLIVSRLLVPARSCRVVVCCRRRLRDDRRIAERGDGVAAAAACAPRRRLVVGPCAVRPPGALAPRIPAIPPPAYDSDRVLPAELVPAYPMTWASLAPFTTTCCGDAGEPSYAGPDEVNGICRSRGTRRPPARVAAMRQWSRGHAACCLRPAAGSRADTLDRARRATNGSSATPETGPRRRAVPVRPSRMLDSGDLALTSQPPEHADKDDTCVPSPSPGKTLLALTAAAAFGGFAATAMHDALDIPARAAPTTAGDLARHGRAAGLRRRPGAAVAGADAASACCRRWSACTASSACGSTIPSPNDPMFRRLFPQRAAGTDQPVAGFGRDRRRRARPGADQPPRRSRAPTRCR